MKITRINSPKFRVGRYVLNEYEARQFCLEVAKGERAPGDTIKDVEGNTATVLRDGGLSRSLVGWDIGSKIAIERYKVIENMRCAQKNWKTLADVPVNEDNELDEEFIAVTKRAGKISFEKGMDAEEVWHWFEEFYDISIVEDLLHSDFEY
jgi:hypothetical protein